MHNIAAILVTITSEDKAVATSISYLFRYTGSLLGVALSGAIEQWVLAKELRRRITGDGAAAVHLLSRLSERTP